MPVLEVFFDYACPYCLRGHQALEALAPQYPALDIRWCPCEAHPRPDRYGPHSDLCIRGLFYALDHNVDAWVWHRRMYAACLTDFIEVESAFSLASYVQDLVDKTDFSSALLAGQYAGALARANDYAYEKSGVWAVPAYRMEGRRLDAVEDVGVSATQLQAFLDAAL